MLVVLLNDECVLDLGVVSTLAGGGATGTIVAGNVNAVGVLAKFSGPRGLAIDSSSNVFVADSTNNVIRKITPTST